MSRTFKETPAGRAALSRSLKRSGGGVHRPPNERQQERLVIREELRTILVQTRTRTILVHDEEE